MARELGISRRTIERWNTIDGFPERKPRRRPLNPLAPYLTTDVSISLQQQVAAKKASGMSVSEAVKEVATSFLQSKGLL